MADIKWQRSMCSPIPSPHPARTGSFIECSGGLGALRPSSKVDEDDMDTENRNPLAFSTTLAPRGTLLDCDLSPCWHRRTHHAEPEPHAPHRRSVSTSVRYGLVESWCPGHGDLAGRCWETPDPGCLSWVDPRPGSLVVMHRCTDASWQPRGGLTCHVVTGSFS
jgi:hypothetical protein